MSEDTNKLTTDNLQLVLTNVLIRSISEHKRFIVSVATRLTSRCERIFNDYFVT